MTDRYRVTNGAGAEAIGNDWHAAHAIAEEWRALGDEDVRVETITDTDDTDGAE